MESKEIIVTCLPKLASHVATELRELGYPVVQVGHQSVTTNGTMEDCMRLNLTLRCANRVLFLIQSFGAVHPDHLYKQVKKLAWERWIDPQGYVSVNSYVKHPTIKDNRFANLRVKDAIVDRIMTRTSKRPDSGPELNGTVIFLHWVDKQSHLYFDTSGESISKHGYRKFPHKAPLHETLAASIIKSTGWNGQSTFINPMCGSGTLAIEAALLTNCIYPAISRKNYALMHINPFDDQAWGRLISEYSTLDHSSRNTRIIATDISGRAVEAARKNAVAAKVDHLIEFRKCRFEQTEIPEGDGVVILNPEYGERMGEESELVDTYRRIGDFFKQKCMGKTGYIFTGNLSLAKKVGLRTKRRIEFLNGKIDCRLLEYELYSGSKN